MDSDGYYWFDSPTMEYGIEEDEPEDDQEESQTESPSLPSLPLSLQEQLACPAITNSQRNQAMSMKEIDSKLNNLRRENFDLKLRLFYEKQNKGVRRSDGDSFIEKDYDKYEKTLEEYKNPLEAKDRQLNLMKNRLEENVKDKGFELNILRTEREPFASDLQVTTSICKSFMSHLYDVRDFWARHLKEKGIQQKENFIDSVNYWLNSSEDLLNSASVLISAFCILLLCSYFEVATGQVIELSNNGPVTIDTPITFTIKNNYSTINPSYEYRIEFPNFDEYNATINSKDTEVTYKVIFSSPKAKQSYYTINVEVWYCISGVPSYSIGQVLTSFFLVESVIGFINVTQDIQHSILENDFVSTKSLVNLTAELYDPSSFYDSANITYHWMVNGSPQEDIYNRFIIRNFSQPQLNNISVTVSINRTNFQKSAFWYISLQSKDPIHNLTADGHTNVELFRDKILQLNIKIDGGTPPFFYCWEITNSTTLGKICKHTNESLFSITRYFSEKGKKTLIISVQNDVSSFTKNMTILIHDIEHQTQLSFILIPIFSNIIAIFIIIVGIVLHMKQRRALAVEVADADFQSIDERMERTFWERIRDSFTQSTPVQLFELCSFTRLNVDHDGDDVSIAESVINADNLRSIDDLTDADVSVGSNP